MNAPAWPESKQTVVVGARVRPVVAAVIRHAAAQNRRSVSSVVAEILTDTARDGTLTTRTSAD